MIFNQILIPLIIALLSISVLFAIRSIVFRLLHSWTEKIKTEIGDIIIRAFKTPSVYWCIAIGLYIGIAISEFSEKYVFYISKSVQIIVILSITIATANLSEKIFKNYVQRMELPVQT